MCTWGKTVILGKEHEEPCPSMFREGSCARDLQDGPQTQQSAKTAHRIALELYS